MHLLGSTGIPRSFKLVDLLGVAAILAAFLAAEFRQNREDRAAIMAFATRGGPAENCVQTTRWKSPPATWWFSIFPSHDNRHLVALNISPRHSPLVSDRLSERQFEILHRLRQLRVLHVSDLRFDTGDVRRLAKLRTLQHLHFNRCDIDPADWRYLTEQLPRTYVTRGTP